VIICAPNCRTRRSQWQSRDSGPTIHPSDRGVQYASSDYRKALQSAGITASMSRKADCFDNTPMECFLHTLKTELVHHRQCATRADAQRDIFVFIESFHNRARLHPAIGCISPIEMERPLNLVHFFGGGSLAMLQP
jgi:putative transposase